MKTITKTTQKAVFSIENKEKVIMGIIKNVPDCNFTVKTAKISIAVIVETPYEWQITTIFKNGMVTEDIQLQRDSLIHIVTPINCL